MRALGAAPDQQWRTQSAVCPAAPPHRRDLDFVAAVQAAGAAPIPVSQRAGHFDHVAGTVGQQTLSQRHDGGYAVDAVGAYRWGCLLPTAVADRPRADDESAADYLIAVRQRPNLGAGGEFADELHAVEVAERIRDGGRWRWCRWCFGG